MKRPRATVSTVSDGEAIHAFEPEAAGSAECKHCDRPRGDRIHSRSRQHNTDKYHGLNNTELQSAVYRLDAALREIRDIKDFDDLDSNLLKQCIQIASAAIGKAEGKS